MAKKLKVGDKFVFHKCKANKEYLPTDFIIGKVYTVEADTDGSLFFYDRDGDGRSVAAWTGDDVLTKVTKIVS
jgi:hypothetical protein